MLLCRLFYILLLTIQSAENVQINLYNTIKISATDLAFDCIYYVHSDEARGRIKIHNSVGHQIIPYCLRPIDTCEPSFSEALPRKQGVLYTFEELRSRQISSHDLYTWSAPVDIAEDYELYLSNPTYNGRFLFFYNCTLPWFGVVCQYTFDYEVNYSIAGFIDIIFDSKIKYKKISNFTCYVHLQCDRGPHPLCLDWREICDGFVDCSNGIDEENCWKLELNECADHEYRCHNGQCIPEEYILDDQSRPECIDSTDETEGSLVYSRCVFDPTMRCEDQVCMLTRDTSSFACGDGQCIQEPGIYTYKCSNGRDVFWAYTSTIYSKNLSFECLMAMVCITKIVPETTFNINCNHYCQTDSCHKVIAQNCPSLFEFPAALAILGHVYLVYTNDQLIFHENIIVPNYVCYDDALCDDFLSPTIRINGRACRHYNETVQNKYKTSVKFPWGSILYDVRYTFEACISKRALENERLCYHREAYHCTNSSKCISKHRLVDGRRDCHNNDDEFADACTLKNEYRFKCSKKDANKCVALFQVGGGLQDCPDGEDEIRGILLLNDASIAQSLINYNNLWSKHEAEKYIFFPKICNKHPQIPPILIEGQNQTDETECGYWSCNNTYTQCDGFWDCKNGIDEVDCIPSKCPPLHHLCVSRTTLKLNCLSIIKAGNDVIDCLGGTDEAQQCEPQRFRLHTFQCTRILGKVCVMLNDLCNKNYDCLFGDDERFCQNYMTGFERLCSNRIPTFNRSEEEDFLCGFKGPLKTIRTYFTFNNASYNILSADSQKAHQPKQKLISIENDFIRRDDFIWAWQCNRGLRVNIYSENSSEYRCLCPPGYYGNICQYQNQRISLITQVHTRTYEDTVFTIVLLLMKDEHGTIESYDHIEFISSRDCGKKYRFNLLYSIRPKDETKNYSVRMDIFDRHSMQYRGSSSYPVVFPFLPVNRIANILIIPPYQEELICNTLNCGAHGRCMKFWNTDESFCKCNDGWSGTKCMTSISLNFHCAPGSIFTGVVHNRPICVCPLDKFGPRCYLKHMSCTDKMCKNGSICAFSDERMLDLEPVCMCTKGYSGKRCEKEDVKIDISFENLPIPPAILLHFITANDDELESRVTIFKNVPVDQTSANMYVSFVFHLLFVEFFESLYLIHMKETHIPGETIATTVKPSDRCLSITEIFHVNITELHQLRRVKHYPIACEQQPNLMCFYDDSYLCFCEYNRMPNCFVFSQNMTYNCQGYNYCKSGGQCFQNRFICPISSMCACAECFYGSRCQFSSRGFGLSLDLILGPHVRPKNYSYVVRVGILIVSLMTIVGLANGVFSVLTFQTEKSRESACGLYLLVSSVISIFITIFLFLKVLLLILSQKLLITNPSFILLQCKSIDFLLNISLNTDNWLKACVTIERVIIVIKGTKFNTITSKQTCKWIILTLLLLNISTSVQDPIHRRLVNDDEDQRIWCVAEYSSLMQIFNSIFYLFHFLMPFAINMISALIIIIRISQQRVTTHSYQTFKKHCREQLMKHKHLVISPMILVLLSLPRLLISFLPGCMKTFRDPWIFLAGYFVSFIPSLVSFVIFVLPSDMYKKECLHALRRTK